MVCDGRNGGLVRGFVQLFQDLGGTLRLETEAGEITIDERSRRANGVLLKDGERLRADAVVSNADVAFTYLNLVPSRYRRVNTDRKVKGMSYSMSLFVIYFGTDRRYEDIAHHEMLMGPRYKGLISEIFRHDRLSDDFSLYLHRPTATRSQPGTAGLRLVVCALASTAPGRQA
ncbi:MAG: FAD-dependent oxidoreductase [Pyrinomonadaceae bacterium]